MRILKIGDGGGGIEFIFLGFGILTIRILSDRELRYYEQLKLGNTVFWL